MHAAIVPVAPTVELKRILVATDFSPASGPALAVANLLAEHYGSELEIANAWSIPPLAATALEMGVPASSVIQQAAEEQLNSLVKSERTKGFKVKGLLRFGDPVEYVRSLVQNELPDLLVVGTHGSTGVTHTVLGSVAENLIREVPCPVLTVGPNLEGRFLHANDLKEVLVPTDLSPHSLAVIPYLVAITAEFRANVHFLHVMPKESQADLRATAAVQERIEKLCNCYFSPRALTWSGVEFGDAAERILAAAGNQSADLIAMGVKPVGRFMTQLRTSLGYKIIASANCPVLTVKHA